MDKVEDEKKRLAKARLQKKADLMKIRIDEAIKERERMEKEKDLDMNIKKARKILHRRRKVNLEVEDDEWPSEAF